MSQRIKVPGDWSFWGGLRAVFMAMMLLMSIAGFCFYMYSAERIGQCEILMLSIWCCTVFLALKK